MQQYADRAYGVLVTAKLKVDGKSARDVNMIEENRENTSAWTAKQKRKYQQASAAIIYFIISVDHSLMQINICSG